MRSSLTQFLAFLNTAAATDECNGKGHHLVLLTDPRFSYQVPLTAYQGTCFTFHEDKGDQRARARVQVSLENDYVGYVTVFLPMYVALLIPSAFAWYFAALAYQFYCWRVIGTPSPPPTSVRSCECGDASAVVTPRILTVLWAVQDRSRRWSHRSTGSPPISAGS
jgi:hypothetical protein